MKRFRSLVWTMIIGGTVMSSKAHALDLYKCETVVEMGNGKFSAERSLYANGTYFGQFGYWNGLDSAANSKFLRLGLFMAPTRLSGSAQKIVLSVKRVNNKGKRDKFRKNALLRVTAEDADQYLDIRRRYESNWADFNIDMDELLTIFGDRGPIILSVYEPVKARGYEKTDILELDMAVVQTINDAALQASVKLDEMQRDYKKACVANFGPDRINEVGESDEVIVFSER